VCRLFIKYENERIRLHAVTVLEDTVLVLSLGYLKKGLALGLVTKVLGLCLGLANMLLVLVLILRLTYCTFQASKFVYSQLNCVPY